MLLELLIDCPDTIARGNAAHTLKVVLCKLKVLEKDLLISNEQETVTVDGAEVTRPKALSARFMELLTSMLNTRVAKQFTRFENCLDLISAFALYSAEEV